jgi:hypothetical protein
LRRHESAEQEVARNASLDVARALSGPLEGEVVDSAYRVQKDSNQHLEDRMKRWMCSLLWISFFTASCGGTGDAVEHEVPSSVSQSLIKCAQTQVYGSVPVEWTQCDVWVLNPSTGRFDCKPGTQRMVTTVICANSCGTDDATLVCTFTDSAGGTRIIDKPNREPDSVAWEACNSCNVCGGQPDPNCRHTLAGGTITGTIP